MIGAKPKYNIKNKMAQVSITQNYVMGRGKGKGISLSDLKEKLESGERVSRSKISKEDLFMNKERKINDRFAKNNSDVVFFKDTCYKVTGSATFKDGFSWRCGHAKYHISIDEKNEENDEHYIYMVIGEKQIRMDDETVEWPEFDQDIYDETMVGRNLISETKWKHKLLSDDLTLKMKEDLHHIRSGKTRKRKGENFNHDGNGKSAKHYE